MIEDASQIVLRFNRLMRDLETGTPSRNSYAPWEVELLLDFDGCEIAPGDRHRLLERYQKVARRKLEQGESPMKFSEYIAGLGTRTPRVNSQVS